jgi:hypothetical protein
MQGKDSTTELESCYVAQAGLKLEILLPQPPECWSYKCVLPQLASNTVFVDKLSMH